MPWPSVTITQLNTYSGAARAIERTLLYVGHAKANQGTVQAVTANSDMDAIFGTDDGLLKGNVKAALLNAGQNAFCYACILPDAAPIEGRAAKGAKAGEPLWVDAIRQAQQLVAVEGAVLVEPVSTPAEINAAQALRVEINNTFDRWVWFALSVEGIGAAQSWAEYVATLTALQKGIAAAQVMLVPEIFGHDIGVLAGRLCNAAVTVADSPARVATGPLVGLKSTDKPTDKDRKAIDLATLQALARVRYSVPMWYADYDGLYWADGVTLDVEGGDYQAIEYVRTVDKVARRVRLMAIPKIANRTLNSTPGSIASHEMLFSAPLREMSKTQQINRVTFPGEVKPPQSGDVSILWKDKDTVSINIVVRPYASPKTIQVGIQLDTSLETKV